MENYDRVKELTEESAESAGTADQKYEAYLDSMEAAIKRVENAWESFTMKLESSGILRTWSKALAGVVENLDKIVPLVMTLLTVGNSSKIFNFFAGAGPSGGAKGLVGRLFGRQSGTVSFNDEGAPVYKANDRVSTYLGANSWLGKEIHQIVENTSVTAKKGTATGSGGVVMSGGKVYTTEELKQYHGIYKDWSKYQTSSRSVAEYGLGKALKAHSPEDLSGLTDTKGYQRLNKLREKRRAKFDEKFNSMTPEQQTAYLNYVNNGGEEAYKAMKAAERKQRTQQAGTAAAMAVLSRAMQNKQVGQSGISSLLAKSQGLEGVSVEETGADKAIGVALTGIGAGVGAYFGGPLGAMLGQSIGDGVSDIISYLTHRDELKNQKEIAETKERLGALNEIEDAINGNDSLMEKERFSTEDYNALEKYIDNVNKSVEKYIDANGSSSEFLSTISKNLSEQTKKDIGAYNSIGELLNKLYDAAADIREDVQKSIKLAEAETELKEVSTLRTQTQNKTHNILEGVKNKQTENEGWIKFWQGLLFAFNGGNWVSKYNPWGGLNTENLNRLADDLKDRIERTKNNAALPDSERDKMVDELEKELSKVEKQIEAGYEVERKYAEQAAYVGFLKSNVSDLTKLEMQDKTFEGIVQEIANSSEGSRTSAGVIKKEYRTEIEKLIKNNPKFSSLLQGDTKTIGDLVNATKQLNDIIALSGKTGYDYYKLMDLLTYQTDAAKKEFSDFADSVNMSTDELETIVRAADPQRITDFASAWNTTEERAKELAKTIPLLSTSMGMLTTTGVKEYFASLNDVFKDLIDNTYVSIENIDVLIQKFPKLIDSLLGSEKGDLKTLFSYINDAQAVAQANAVYTSYMNDTAVYNDFIESKREEIDKLNAKIASGDASEEDKQRKDFLTNYLKTTGKATKFQDVANLIGEGKLDENQEKEFKSWFADKQFTFSYENAELNGMIELQTHYLEEQTSMLQEQIDALSKINEQQKKEAEYLKAKDNLENAKKNKDAVYRAGVGWTYEANEDNIQKAFEEVEDLNIEKQQQQLQAQVDSLNVQKSILDNLQKNTHLENLEKSFSDFVGKDGTEGKFGTTISKLEKAYKEQKITVNLAKGTVTYTGTDEYGNPSTKEVEAGGLDDELEYLKIQKEKESAALNSLKALKNTLENKLRSQDKSAENYKKYNSYLAAYERVYDEYQKQAVQFGETPDDKYIADYFYFGNIGTMDVDAKNTNTGLRSVKYTDANGETNNVATGGKKVGLNRTTTSQISTLELDSLSDEGEMWYINGEYYIKLKDNTWRAVATDDKSSGWADANRLSDDFIKYAENFIKTNYSKGVDMNNLDAADLELYNQFISGELGKTAATGSLDLPGGNTLINELGTEAIITPEGTMTALPAHTGIVPADITKNLWSLGEVAPNLIARLKSLDTGNFKSNIGNTTYEEGQYIDHLTMNVYPTKDYDMDKLLAEARAKVKLTRHNN